MIPQVLSSNYELGHNHHTPPAMVCDKRKLYSSTFASDLAILMDLRHTGDYRVHDLGKTDPACPQQCEQIRQCRQEENLSWLNGFPTRDDA
jgi:hypothetical protein